MPPGEELALRQAAVQREPLVDAERPSRAAGEQLALLRDREPAASQIFVQPKEQAIEALAIERPVAHWPAVEMEKTGMRVPADPTALHRARRLHRLLEAGLETDIERAAIEVLAV